MDKLACWIYSFFYEQTYSWILVTWIIFKSTGVYESCGSVGINQKYIKLDNLEINSYVYVYSVA